MGILLWTTVTAALAALVAGAPPSPKGLKSGLTILINNDLQGSSSPYSTSGVILLSRRRSHGEAVTACQALGEQLWSPELNTASIQTNLDYLQYQGRAGNSTTFWIAAAAAAAAAAASTSSTARAIGVSGVITSVDAAQRLPALCTQTAPYSSENVQDTGPTWQVAVEANNQTLTGFRDRLSFRFLGIRYALQPKRFTYSSQFQGSGEAASALSYGAQCAQGSSGSEDCLFLNIWTPYLPNPGCEAKKKLLRPVGLWIHGGAFTGGTANDATFDGGNIASRGDMVLVAINYRLSNLGFLALEDGVTNGNFGLADQITALDWVRAHIRSFGGDPDRITIFGQSAGAASTRALMASPKAIGKFAGAIPISNLGGINYGTTYSRYYTIAEQATAVGNAVLSAAGCTSATSQVDCLRALPAAKLTSLGSIARYPVVDGVYLTSPELDLSAGPPLPVHLMMGITHDDGAAIISYPKTTNQSAFLAAQGFAIPPPALFPLGTSGNETLDLYNASSRLATDGIFRCVDQATVYRGLASGRLGPAVYYYEFDRSYQTTGWPGTDVCQPPRTASHPHGDPSLPYFKCHSGELYYVFGNLARQGLPMRDEHDLPFEQLVLDRFAAFVRTYDPNPDGGFLRARGYASTLGEVEREGGRWEPSVKGSGLGGMTMRALEWPSWQGGFREVEQCEGLGLGVEGYYGEK
ncbi:Alpha/Beta hydrolase protein [Bombardia bombarda]|uniref:Carboxylic ester hydrolase n=1 Tax=Bombardia bombarda TaxID=252184 RepID=A0AA40C217_9PEZI|nr:Alpha/Beta hydrolase protein [Bombardia bombarda]